MPPDVLVVTVTLPVSWVHVIVNAAVTLPLGGTVTVCGFASLTVQLLGTPLSCTA